MGAELTARSRKPLAFGLLAASLLAGAAFVRFTNPAGLASYSIRHRAPVGWKRLSSSGAAVFLYRHATSGALIKGTVQRIPPEYVAPGPDAWKLAQDFVNSTRSSMPGWQARELGKVGGGPVAFMAVRRWSAEKTVVSAFAVRGGSTLVIDMTCGSTGASDALWADYLAVLNSVRWVRQPVRP